MHHADTTLILIFEYYLSSTCDRVYDVVSESDTWGIMILYHLKDIIEN